MSSSNVVKVPPSFAHKYFGGGGGGGLPNLSGMESILGVLDPNEGQNNIISQWIDFT
jgi:hypothetical protein